MITSLHFSRLKSAQPLYVINTPIVLDTVPINPYLKESDKRWIMKEIKLEIDSLIRYGPSVVTAPEETIDQVGRFLFFILLLDTSSPTKETESIQPIPTQRLL